MVISKRLHNMIMKKYQNDFYELEHYDRTREKLWGRSRIDITLHQRVIRKLRALSKKKGKPLSHIIEEAVSKLEFQ
jgi:DNA-binding sugar fermentation-stimulating protein